jgi:hypothetical protein
MRRLAVLMLPLALGGCGSFLPTFAIGIGSAVVEDLYGKIVADKIKSTVGWQKMEANIERRPVDAPDIEGIKAGLER